MVTSEQEDTSSTVHSPDKPKASKIYYAIGLPISNPKTDPKDKHVHWLLEQFSAMEIPQEDQEFDIFQALLDQTDIYNLESIDLRDFMLDFIIKHRDLIEPVILNNLKARSITFERYVNCMAKGTTSGLDVTLKCLSMMLRKAIVVLVEDYLWFTHNRPIQEIELAMILRKNGKFTGLRRKDGKLLGCNLPFLKEWMKSQTQTVPPEYSSEKSDNFDGSEIDSENTEESEIKFSEVNERSENTHSDAQNRSRVDHDHSYDGSKTIDGEYVINVKSTKPVKILSVRDIDSGDKESLIPSNNSGIAATGYVSGVSSDTTFDSVVDSIIMQDNLGSPKEGIPAENNPEHTDLVASVEVVTTDNSANVVNTKLDEHVVARSDSQNEECDAPTAFNTAVELVSDNTKNSVNESDGSAVFGSVNTDKVNVPGQEETENGSVDTDQPIVSTEDSRALQSPKGFVQSSEVNIPDVSTNTADTLHGTNESSLKESDGNSSEYATTDLSLQYLTDEGKFFNINFN